MGIQLVQQPRPMVTKPSGWRTAAGLAALGKKLIGQYKQKMLQQEIQDVMRQSDDMAGFTQGMGDIYGRMNEDRGFFGGIGDQFNPGTLRGTEMDPQTEKMMMNALMSKLGRSDELADEKRQDERRMELERTMKAEGLGGYAPSRTTKMDKSFNATEMEDWTFQLQASDGLPSWDDWKTLSGYEARTPTQKKQLRMIYAQEKKGTKNGEGTSKGAEPGKMESWTGNVASKMTKMTKTTRALSTLSEGLKSGSIDQEDYELALKMIEKAPERADEVMESLGFTRR